MTSRADKSPDAVHQSGRAAVAHYLGWPIRDVSIQGLAADAGARIGSCRLGTDSIPRDTEEDILRSILFGFAGLAAEYLLGIETSQPVTARIMDAAYEDAARAFPNDRQRQRAMVKTGLDTACEIVRQHRPAIEALVAALVRLERVSGPTAEHFFKTSSQTPELTRERAF
jgi:hypothetical protein